MFGAFGSVSPRTPIFSAPAFTIVKGTCTFALTIV
jgi:hypothetical protein